MKTWPWSPGAPHTPSLFGSLLYIYIYIYPYVQFGSLVGKWHHYFEGLLRPSSSGPYAGMQQLGVGACRVVHLERAQDVARGGSCLFGISQCFSTRNLGSGRDSLRCYQGFIRISRYLGALNRRPRTLGGESGALHKAGSLCGNVLPCAVRVTDYSDLYSRPMV